jgi:hypothetical protein
LVAPDLSLISLQVGLPLLASRVRVRASCPPQSLCPRGDEASAARIVFASELARCPLLSHEEELRFLPLNAIHVRAFVAGNYHEGSWVGSDRLVLGEPDAYAFDAFGMTAFAQDLQFVPVLNVNDALVHLAKHRLVLRTPQFRLTQDAATLYRVLDHVEGYAGTLPWTRKSKAWSGCSERVTRRWKTYARVRPTCTKTRFQL